MQQGSCKHNTAQRALSLADARKAVARTHRAGSNHQRRGRETGCTNAYEQTHDGLRREKWPPLAALRDPLCQSLRSDGTSYSERFGCHHRACNAGVGAATREKGGKKGKRQRPQRGSICLKNA
jgi:hypothetical protein